MKYDTPRAETVVFSTDAVMDSLDVENVLGFWDMFGEQDASFKADNAMDIWDMLHQ